MLFVALGLVFVPVEGGTDLELLAVREAVIAGLFGARSAAVEHSPAVQKLWKKLVDDATEFGSVFSDPSHEALRLCPALCAFCVSLTPDQCH